MKRLILLLCVCAFPAAAQTPLVKAGQMAVGPNRLDAFDIGTVDQANEVYYLADKSNKSLDMFDLVTGKLAAQVGGFVGDTGSYTTGGPNGVVIAGGEAWVGDGDSTVKVIDIVHRTLARTISTGGTGRLDEVAFDPRDGVFIGINDRDTPPFATLIAAGSGGQARVVVDRATDGLEQPVYNPADGLFYVAIPELDHIAGQGGIAVIDPVAGRLVTIFEFSDCGGTGLARGPGTTLLMGCRLAKDGLAPRTIVFDTETGMLAATVAGVGGADMVAYEVRANRYFVAAGRMPGGPVLGVIDASTNAALPPVPTGPGAHSVAVDEARGAVLVPISGKDGGCGCVQVFRAP